ncbi:MAG: putative peptidoglycan glycosyltransferase FtsW [Chlamydiota bacterium]
MRTSVFILLAAICILFAIGLIMVFNTTSAEILDRHLEVSTHRSLIRQLIAGCVSLMAGLVVWFFGYQRIFPWVSYVFYLVLILLVAVFIPGIGQKINGANRWIGWGLLSFHPSEIMKIALPLYCIRLIEKTKPMTWRRFYQLALIAALPIGLILIEPDMGTSMMLFCVLGALFFLCRIRLLYWLLPACCFGLVAVGAALQMPHVKQRLKVYLHPELDRLGKGHQPYQAKIAAGSGGLLGLGIGKSLQKLNYLPEARSDYIAAIYAEEFGFVGVVFLVFLYLLVASSGFYIALRAPDRQGFYLAAILTFLLSFQAFLNLGVVSGLLPSKGINLPFFSQGGSSLLANTLIIVLIMSVGKRLPRKEPKFRRKFEPPVTPMDARHSFGSLSNQNSRDSYKDQVKTRTNNCDFG